MDDQIIGLHDWFATPPGRYLLAWERLQLDHAVADIFGYHALQLGLGELDALSSNRMPHRWLACTNPIAGATLVTDFSALPFPSAALDLVVLPHSLELATDPHATLREVERVLVPEGRVVITGLNPVSFWALRQRSRRLYQRVRFGKPSFLPREGLIGYWRLRDWLRLLNFEVEIGRFGCYRPAIESEKWLRRLDWMDRVGARWWPVFGTVYFLVAVKRVHAVTLLSPTWKAAKGPAIATISIAGRVMLTGSEGLNDTRTRNED